MDLQEASTEELEQMIRQYPYFAPARWWTARRKWEQGDRHALSEAATFSFYPLRLRAFLQSPSEAAPRNPPAAVDAPAVVDAPEAVDTPEAVDAPEVANNTPPATGHLPPADEPLIQPLYAEDYFAYAGVRLPEDQYDAKKPTMAQLLSFTDWLRTMRRPRGSVDPDLRPEEIEAAEQNDARQSASVRKMAVASVQVKEDILTEAMAEVRVRQGQTEKAIKIYEKLSLLNPEKSGYFALKINALKNSY